MPVFQSVKVATATCEGSIAVPETAMAFDVCSKKCLREALEQIRENLESREHGALPENPPDESRERRRRRHHG
jgi:hypothetical protein